LGSAIEFREGNAQSMPLADDSFDVAVSVTVIEEVDADRMLAEMVRVTKPGGRVAVVARAIDMPFFRHLPLSPDLKVKVESTGGGVAAQGCADASLYKRMRQAGLTQVTDAAPVGGLRPFGADLSWISCRVTSFRG
jgi:SAM-dependent methyltransferase